MNRSGNRPSRFWKLLAPMILAAAAFQIAEPLLTRTPLTGDHPVHLFKAWHFYDKMLPSLTLRGFSYYWVFGHPAGELVPFGEELWVALARIVTFERFDWLRTYAIALIGLIGLIAGSAYALANRFFGPRVGLVSALLVLWDPGAWAQGGWEWFMTIGVWPNSLGMSLLALTVVALDRVAEQPSRLRIAIASFTVAAAFWAHQIAIPFAPVLLALLLLDLWARGRASTGSVGGVLGAFVLGLFVSGAYLVPMLARSGLTLDLGVPGVSAGQLGERLVDEQPFHNQWGPLATLGFVGAFLALKRRLPGAVLFSLGTGIFVLASTDIAFSEFHLERLVPGLTKIEAMRMLVGAKALWFPLVAYALVEPFGALARALQGLRLSNVRSFLSPGMRRWIVVWTLGVALVGPYLPGATSKLIRTKIRKEVPAQAVPFWSDMLPLLEKTKRLRRESSSLYRIAYDLPMHTHIATLAPVWDDTWVYKVGYTPTQAFWAFPMYFDEELFEKLLVQYVVSNRELSERSYELLETSGQLRLYRFRRYRGEPFRIHGPGRAKVLEFSPERIRLSVSDTGASSRLELFVSNFDRWNARYGDNTVPILPATVRGPENPFLMEVPARDGELVFEYVKRLPDTLGLALSVGSLLVLLILFASKSAAVRVQRVAARLADTWRFRPGLRRPVYGAMGLLGALGLAMVGHRLSSRNSLVAQDSLFRSLAPGALTLDDAPCVEDAPFLFSCGTGTVEAARVAGLYGSHVCFTAKGEKLALRTSERFSALQGRYDPRQGQGAIRLAVNGHSTTVKARGVDQGQQFLRFDLRELPEEGAQLEVEIRGSALHCFDLTGVR